MAREMDRESVILLCFISQLDRTCDIDRFQDLIYVDCRLALCKGVCSRATLTPQLFDDLWVRDYFTMNRLFFI